MFTHVTGKKAPFKRQGSAVGVGGRQDLELCTRAAWVPVPILQMVVMTPEQVTDLH